jgi:ectoine hydroxylase-related dioxygenase (phytanoyl-CoA dioxygenase family)
VGIRADLDAQGYFELPPTIDPALVARARDAVTDAHTRGVPTVHAFLDDSLWELREALVPIARDALGGEVVSMPAYWAWRVGPGSRGWPPHRDRHQLFRAEDGTLACVTLWVALTDATAANGCMYCVPSYWDYEYEREHPGIVVANEQYLRALPAPAGAVLGWTHTLLHWGGACTTNAPPRVSASYEMVRAEVAAAAGIEGVRAPGAIPTREERAAIVEAQVAQYRHFTEQITR